MPEDVNERTASLEARMDHAERHVCEISGMEKAIERLSVKIEGQEASLNNINSTLKELITITSELKDVKTAIKEMKEEVRVLKETVVADEVKLAHIEHLQATEAEFKREKMKSRYGFWGAIVVAAISLIASIISLAA